jgi:FkbM family methyltransferase
MTHWIAWANERYNGLPALGWVLPNRLRVSLGFAASYSKVVDARFSSTFLKGLSRAGSRDLALNLLLRLSKMEGFPDIKLDDRTDPGAVKEVLVDREYDYPGFIPDSEWAVLDIGAQHGEFALLSGRVRSARVWAFEPMEENCTVIRSNLVLNSDSNVRLFPFALGSRDSELTGRVYSGMFIAPTVGAPRQRARVVQRRLDGLSLQLGAPPGKVLMKVDVEGFEYDVLDGATEFIDDMSPRIVIETSHRLREKVIRTLKSHAGYSICGERRKTRSSILFSSRD